MLIHYTQDSERPFEIVLHTDKIIIVKHGNNYFRVKEWCYCGNNLIGGYQAGYNVDLVPLDEAELEKYSEDIKNNSK